MSSEQDRIQEIKRNADKISGEILTLTRNGLFVSLRFLDVALCQMDFVSDEQVDRIATTGQSVLFNPKYVISRYLKEKQVLSRDYLHMVMHCIFRHPFVSDKLDRRSWDLACDIAVEGIISELDVKQADTDDSEVVRSALQKVRERAGKLTAEKIYNYIQSGGFTPREIKEFSDIFFRDEHDIWWEIARKAKEEAEAEAEAKERQDEEDKAKDYPDEDMPESQDFEEETTDEEEDQQQPGDEAQDEAENQDGRQPEDQEPPEDQDGESEDDDNDAPSQEEETLDDQEEQDGRDGEEEESDDKDSDMELTRGGAGEGEDDEEPGEGKENPEGGDETDKKEGDGTKDVNDGNFGENADAESEQDSNGRTGQGENQGEEDSSSPDEGGAMQQGASEPQIGDIAQQKQEKSTPNRSNTKRKAGMPQDNSEGGGDAGGSSMQAAWQHQSAGGEKKGAGSGDSETRPELEGEHQSAGPGGDQTPDQDEKGQRGRENRPDGESEKSDKYSQEKLDELEKKWREISERLLVDLETSSKEWGDKSDAMLQSLKNINRDRYDYTTFLRKFAVYREDIQVNPDEFDYVYYTFGLKHYGNMPLVEPLEYREVKKINEFVIAIDTSGSCSGEIVQKFLDKTYSILMQQENFFKKINVHIIQCDAEIQEAVKITTKEEFDDYLKNLTFKGFGGTDFRPVFEYVNYMIEQGEFRDLKGLIYFTDGNGTYPLKRPKYETAFVFVDDNEFEYEVPSWAIKLVLESSDILEEEKVKVNI